jgi:hypothetical protein
MATLRWIAVLLIVCICVPTQVQAQAPTYDVSYCMSSLGWTDDDGSEHTGGMCQDAAFERTYSKGFWNAVMINAVDYSADTYIVYEQDQPNALLWAAAQSWIDGQIEALWLQGRNQ